MIESHLIENGRVQVVDVDTVLDGRAAEHVSGTVAVAGFHAATSHPDGEAVVIVVAAVFTLGSWCAAELTAPDNERLIEEATGLEIFEQCGNPLVTGLGQAGVTALDVAMAGVPGDVVAVDRVRKLNRPHTALHEAPGDEAALGILAVAVQVARGLAFLRDIKNVRHAELHAEGHLHRLDAGFDCASFSRRARNPG